MYSKALPVVSPGEGEVTSSLGIETLKGSIANSGSTRFLMRALGALLLVCLVVGNTVLDANFHLTYPSEDRIVGVLLVYALIAVPGFLFLATTRRVQWWHIVSAGLIPAAIYVLVAGRYDAIYGPSYILWLALRCTVSGCAFWLIGIWRNPRYPEVSRGLPTQALAILFAASVAMAFAFVWATPTKIYGRVIDSGYSDRDGSWIVPVQLFVGGAIQSPMMYAKSRVPGAGRCAEVNTRRALASPQWRRYWIENTYDCETKEKRDLSALALASK